VIGRLQTMHEQYQRGTRACVQRAVDAEARLFAVLQERHDAALEEALRAWIDNDLGQLAKAVDESLTMPIGADATALSSPAEPVAADVSEPAMESQPTEFTELTRRALRS